MARIIKYIIITVTILVLVGFFLYKFTSKTWVFDLPNNYKVRATSTANVTIGIEIERDYYTIYQDKHVGIDEYVAQFQYNEQFVGAKALKIENEEPKIIFYLIDTLEREVHGPYKDEESYLAAISVWSKEPLGEWITTTEVPEKAYFK